MLPHPEITVYDDDGNLLADGRFHYRWDGQNRLVEMNSREPAESFSGYKVEHFYEAGGWRRLGRRESARDPMTGAWSVQRETAFIWDGTLLVMEVDQTPAPEGGAVSAKPARSYLWGRDASGSREGAGGVGGLVAVVEHAGFGTAGTVPKAHFAEADGRGNVVAIWESETRTRTEAYEYGPFGEMLRSEAGSGRVNPLRWSSKYDEGVGLVYYGFRFYNPDTGRWLNRDPIEERGGVNLYGMVGNRPTSRVDSLGQKYTPIIREASPGSIMTTYGTYAYTGSPTAPFGIATPYVKADVEHDVTETSDKCCATIQQAQEIDLTVLSVVPSSRAVGLIYTENGLKAVKGHENRRLQVYQLAYDSYLEPVQLKGARVARCGKLARKEPGEAKRMLLNYLAENQRLALNSYAAWVRNQQNAIGAESSGDNWVEVDSLRDHFRTIHVIENPPALPEIPCPISEPK